MAVKKLTAFFGNYIQLYIVYEYMGESERFTHIFDKSISLVRK